MGERPRLVGGGQREDQRVTAVREVLAGEALAEVARRYAVDTAVLHRWVTAFVDAGTAQVTHTPTADEERQRDRFLAAFAHETRTPLTAARGWVAVLRDGDVPPERVEATLERLDHALTRLAERSRDVELLASASLGLVRTDPERVSLSSLAAPVGLTPVSDAELVTDVELMTRVLRDLDDAARTAPAPPRVTLELHRTGPWDDVRVVRHGSPLDPQILRTLFEPFDLNDDGSGITIGLYLARALAVVLGGAVGVDQDDHTTTFWVRVPAQAVPPTATDG